MKILIKSEDAKKLTNLSEQMDATDSGVELGKDLNVDGKIVVNSADDVVDINGQPIAGGLYQHDGFLEDNESNYYNYVCISKVPTKFTSISQLQDASFFANYYPDGDTVNGVTVTESHGEPTGYTINVLGGESYDFSLDELTISDTVK